MLYPATSYKTTFGIRYDKQRELCNRRMEDEHKKCYFFEIQEKDITFV